MKQLEYTEELHKQLLADLPFCPDGNQRPKELEYYIKSFKWRTTREQQSTDVTTTETS